MNIKRTTKKRTPKEDTLLVVEEVVEVTEDRPNKVFGNGLIEEVGVTGTSETNDGVLGLSNGGHGVHGKSTNGHGIVAESLTNYALVARGEKAALLEGYVHIRGAASITGKLNVEVTGEDEAVRGDSHAGIGVHGKSATGSGVVAESSSATAPALVATASVENGAAAKLVGTVKIAGITDITGSSSTSALNVTAGKNGTAARIVGDFSIDGNLTGQTVNDLEKKISDLQATVERICNYLASISSENSLAGISLFNSDSESHR